jgi:RimJ/RimL family protein N-acetyltransferase
MAPPASGPHIIRGGLVYLRPAERQDLPKFVKWLNDAGTSWFLALRAPLSMALEERWFERMLERFGTDVYHFVICRLADDRPIGNIGLELIDTVNGNAALGIVVGEEGDRGAGYGTDAVNALVDFGFGELRLERIWLDVYEGNDRAIRAYEKAGFAREAVLRKAAFHRGEHLDVIRMAILRAEWAGLERPKAWDYEISDRARAGQGPAAADRSSPGTAR